MDRHPLGAIAAWYASETSATGAFEPLFAGVERHGLKDVTKTYRQIEIDEKFHTSLGRQILSTYAKTDEDRAEILRAMRGMRDIAWTSLTPEAVAKALNCLSRSVGTRTEMSQILLQGRPESAEPASRDADGRLLVRVLEVQHEADGVVSIELGSDDTSALPAWSPGAHIDVILPDGLVRQYSLCGVPEDRTRWRIGVLLEPEGRGGSSFIHSRVRAGDALQVAGPRNNFALGDAEEYLFIAGGIGITPILPMVRYVAASRRRWKLLYGGRTRRSMAFLDELTALDGDVLILPQDQHGHPDLPGFIGAYRPGVTVHCCGPGAMIDAIEAACQTWPYFSDTPRTVRCVGEAVRRGRRSVRG